MPTLTESPGYPLETVDDARLLASSPAEGAIGYGQITDQWPRVWRLTWRAAKEAVRTALDSLYDSVAGGALSMDWTPPGAGAALKVRFLPGQDGYRKRRVSAHAWEITVQLEEAHGL